MTDTITALTAPDNWPGNPGGNNLPGGFAVFQNKLFILGGFTIGGSGLNSIYQFDPTLAVGSRWTLNFGRPVAAALLGVALLVGVVAPTVILGLLLRL